MHYMHEAPKKYVPANTNQGWSVAALVGVLTVACIALATVMYQKTYKHPTDPTWKSAVHAAPTAH